MVFFYMDKGYVYIMQSERSGMYYIGSCHNTTKRLLQHNNGKTLATRNKGPWILRLAQEYSTMKEARQVEYKLKRLKRRDYIEQMIQDGYIKKK